MGPFALWDFGRQHAGEQGHSDGDSGHSSGPPQPDVPKPTRGKRKGPLAPREPCRYCDANHSDAECPIHQPLERVADASALWAFGDSPELARQVTTPSSAGFSVASS